MTITEILIDSFEKWGQFEWRRRRIYNKAAYGDSNPIPWDTVEVGNTIRTTSPPIVYRVEYAAPEVQMEAARAVLDHICRGADFDKANVLCETSARSLEGIIIEVVRHLPGKPYPLLGGIHLDIGWLEESEGDDYLNQMIGIVYKGLLSG